MNDRDEIAQLRLLDAFLENGEIDRHDWRDEVGAALDRIRTSYPRGMEPMPEYGGSSFAASGEDADILARLEMMLDEEVGREMSFDKVDAYSDGWGNLINDPAEPGWMVARRSK